MIYKSIPKYEFFFEGFYKHLKQTNLKAELERLIKNGRRDQEQTLLKDFEYGFCPQKGGALKYVPAMVIISNFYIYNDEYDKYTKILKKNRRK